MARNACLALIGAASMALIVCSCSNSSAGGTSNTGSAIHTGGSEAWQEVVKKANAEGKLLYYTDSIDYPAEQAAFEKDYPDIKVSYVRLTSSELEARFASETEAGAKSADIVQFPDQILYAAHPNWFVKLDANLLPDLKNIPAQYNFSTEIEPFTMPYVPTFNTNLVSPLPTTWKDLISPTFANLAGEIGDPRVNASTMAFYQALYKLYGPSYLKTLGAHYKLFSAIATALQDVAAGQAAFAMPSGASAPSQLISAGAPLKTVKMSPEIVDGGFIGISAKAQDPDAALVFMNWLATEQGQKGECMNGENYTVIQAPVPGCQHTPSSAVVMTPASAEKQSAMIVSLLGLK